MKIAQNVTELIGHTPIVKLQTFSKKYGANIFAKCEFMNPNSSVKDRIAYYMIKAGLDNGSIRPTTTIIEATSGNTGVGLASVCAALGLKLVICIPSSMTVERRKLMKALGATLELTAPELGMKGAIAKAEELNSTIKDSVIVNQFSNKANPQAHRETTAEEIIDAFGSTPIDVFVAGVGTGGTLSGVGEVLKAHNQAIKIFAMEPSLSPVLSGGTPAPHKIQGIGTGFIPENLNTHIYDGVLKVTNEEAYEMARLLGKQEGILAGISSGANIQAACMLAKDFPGKNILTTLNDTGERYLSTDLFEE
ncbi:cysteine synthase A [Helicobacter sp. 13S00401-1]|uniref:cysteine synthase A n=1 Tax=Helicobacter sp. 13S00401-1 TaxID=1905758 RepID=UPI000BA524F4|nr:cysteine synthase A [Helicobacter sp. 13S00401-1]PAF51475.1 cysteine synthase A [Helicobacter sp. 13S00401-1]